MNSKFLRPSFLIIGGVKCGTSSLYRYMNVHPNILPCKTKEPQYFSSRNPIKWFLKKSWYFSQFPPRDFFGTLEFDWLDLKQDGTMAASTFKKEKIENQNYITGEASADVMANGLPSFVQSTLPEAKLIVLLRNPTDRFLSHYNMLLRFKNEGRSAHKNLPELLQFVENEISDFKKHKKTKVLYQGLYFMLLNKWEGEFGNENIKTILSKDLKDPSKSQSIMNDLFLWLGLEPFTIDLLGNQFNKATQKVDNSEARAMLDEFYRIPNDLLFQKYNFKL